MSVNYELSVWRDYPGATAIKEEKQCIIAATNLSNYNGAYNIVLKREYTDKNTLTFDLPAIYYDALTGEKVTNELTKIVKPKVKLKLWRDEKWFNPFGGDAINEDGYIHYTGEWQQGRWYDFIINKRTESHNKKKLIYSFECVDLFMNELSRTGYSLEFTNDSSNINEYSIGTIHDLCERVVTDCDWQYIKTEKFLDYKEEYNPITGETVKTPVATAREEALQKEKRYAECYEFTPEDQDKIQSILNNNNLVLNTDYGFDSGKLWYIDKASGLKRNYIYGYTKTNIITSYADKIILQDSGEFSTDTDSNRANLFNSDIGWLAKNGSVGYTSDGKGMMDDEKLKYYLTYTVNTNSIGNYLYNVTYLDKSLNAGEIIALKFETTDSSKTLGFNIFDANGKTELDDSCTKIFDSDITIQCGADSNEFANTYWISIPQYIKNPIFAFSNNSSTTSDTIKIKRCYIYKLVGYSADLNEEILKRISQTTSNAGLLSNFDSTDNTADQYNWATNTYTPSAGVTTPIWLKPGEITQNSYNDNLNVYLIETYNNGEYADIYLPCAQSEVAQITSYDADKRRSISASKSNRYSILETISKTFYAFMRFIVEHEDNGAIKVENGIAKKYFTMVSELGRNQFNGFNYGLNLDSVKRISDAENLVTKVYVAPIDNEYEEDAGQVSIQTSTYNYLRENFIYNFNYFISQGLIDKNQFNKDYKKMADIVNLYNIQILQINKEISAISNKLFSLQNEKYSKIATNKALKTTALNLLTQIRWESLLRFLTENGYSNIPNTQFPNIKLNTILHDLKEEYGDITGITDYELLAEYMNAYIQYQSEEDQVLNINSGPYLCKLTTEEIKNDLEIIDSYQTKYRNYEFDIANLTETIDHLSSSLQAYQSQIDNFMKKKTTAQKYFEKKYAQYVIEGQWDGKDYTNVDTFYFDATRAMSTSCQPKVEYTVGALDLAKLTNPYDPNDLTWGESFIYGVGDTTYIKDIELFGNIEQKSMIASITSYIDKGGQDNIDIRNFETRFEDLFQAVSAAVTQLQINEDIYSRAANFTPEGTIDLDILQNSFTKNKDLVMNSDNNNITWDQHGISVKDGETGQGIVNIISGGIFLSKDGGVTYTNGITPDGINASLITAGEVDTSKVAIRSVGAPNYVLDNLGLTAYDTNSANQNTNSQRSNLLVRFDQFGVYMTKQGDLFNNNWWNDERYSDTSWNGAMKNSYEEYYNNAIAITLKHEVANDFSISNIKALKLFITYNCPAEEGSTNNSIVYTQVSYSNDSIPSNIIGLPLPNQTYTISYHTTTGTGSEITEQITTSDQYMAENTPSKGYKAILSYNISYPSNIYSVTTILDVPSTSIQDDVYRLSISVANHIATITTLDDGEEAYSSKFMYIKYEGLYTVKPWDYIQKNSIFSLTQQGFQYNVDEAGLNCIKLGRIDSPVQYTNNNGYLIVGSGLFIRGNDTTIVIDDKHIIGIWNSQTGKKLFGINSDGRVVCQSIGEVTNSGNYAIVGKDNNIGNWTGLNLYVDNNRLFGFYDAMDSTTSESKQVMVVQDELRITTNDTYNASKNTYSTKFLLNSTGGVLYGDWSVGGKYSDAASNRLTKITSGELTANTISARNTFYLRDEGGTCASFYKSLTGNPVLKSENGLDFLLKGVFEIESYNVRSGTKFIVDGTEIGTVGFGSDSYMNLRMHEFWGFGITNNGQYRFSVNKDGGHLYGDWYGTSGNAVTSDRNKKNTIQSLSNRYSSFFDKLNPVTFKYNDGLSNRLHTGFISQDVEQAITDSNLTSSDFAGFVKDEDGNYYLRYEEFIALNTNEIQKLKKVVNQQSQTIEQLRNEIEQLKSK